MVYEIKEIIAIAKPIAEKYGVNEMYLFGSYARGEADGNSDLDFAYNKETSNIVGLDVIAFQNDLEDAFGLPVDLIEIYSINHNKIDFQGSFKKYFERDRVAVA